MRTIVVTGLWGAAWDRYGRTFAESFARYWPADVELVEAIRSLLPASVKIRALGRYNYSLTIPRGAGSKLRNPIISALRGLQLYGHTAHSKFIPACYKYNSVSTRLAVLQGLLDTDGYSDKSGGIEFSTVSRQLAADVVELVQMLGGTATIRDKSTSWTYKGVKKYGQAFRIRIVLKPEQQPFRLHRKLQACPPHSKYLAHRMMVAATVIGSKEAVCITVDSQDQLYVTDDCILTHNSTLAWALAESRGKPVYMLDCPDALADHATRVNSVQEAMTIPPGSTLIIDDAQQYIASRSSMSKSNIDFQTLIFTARHKQFTIIITAQDSSSIDKTGLVATCYFLKEPTMAYTETERGPMKKIFDQAVAAFRSYPQDRWKEFVFVYRDPDHNGLLQYAPPDWYTASISRYRGRGGGAAASGGGGARTGSGPQTPPSQRVQEYGLEISEPGSSGKDKPADTVPLL